jgi:hypothetical protein
LTATTDQLACYGFPPRPQAGNTAALSQWTTIVSRAVYQMVDPAKVTTGPGVPPPSSASTLAIQPAVANQKNDWSTGYLFYAYSNAQIADGYWKASDVVQSTGHDSHQLDTWVGIQLRGGNPLLQAGTYAADGRASGTK